MPRKVSFSTLREVTVNIEDTVEAEGEARPPPDACKPGGPTRASSSLVYLLLLAALALPWAVTAYAVLYNSGAPPTLAAPPPSRTPPARLLVTEPAHGLVVTPSTSFALPSMEGHMPLVLSRLVLENGVLDLAVSRIDPATAAAGGGGYYSYSEP